VSAREIFILGECVARSAERAGAVSRVSRPALDRGGTTVLRVENGKIAEEIGLDDGVTALQQLGILKVA
jgi:hypothetical protein